MKPDAMPLISVIIPVYHAGKYLTEALASVDAQTYPAIEVVIVNDGSHEADTHLCRDYAARYPSSTIVIEQSNSGQSVARNRGLQAAHGDYIVFLDADDIMAPDFCQQMLQLIQTSGADMASGGHIEFDVRAPQWRTTGQCMTITGREALADMLYQHHITSAPWGKIFRHSAIKGLTFTPGIIYEDLEWLSRVMPHMKSVTVSKNRLYGYRKHPASALGHFSPQRLDVLRVTDEIRRRQTDPELKAAADDRILSASFNILILLIRNGLGSTPEADECRANIRHLRLASLRNPHVRLKNKTGILASMLGWRFIHLLAHISK